MWGGCQVPDTNRQKRRAREHDLLEGELMQKLRYWGSCLCGHTTRSSARSVGFHEAHSLQSKGGVVDSPWIECQGLNRYPFCLPWLLSGVGMIMSVLRISYVLTLIWTDERTADGPGLRRARSPSEETRGNSHNNTCTTQTSPSLAQSAPDRRCSSRPGVS